MFDPTFYHAKLQSTWFHGNPCTTASKWSDYEHVLPKAVSIINNTFQSFPLNASLIYCFYLNYRSCTEGLPVITRPQIKNNLKSHQFLVASYTNKI